MFMDCFGEFDERDSLLAFGAKGLDSRQSDKSEINIDVRMEALESRKKGGADKKKVQMMRIMCTI